MEITAGIVEKGEANMYYVMVVNAGGENEAVYSAHKWHYQAEVFASAVKDHDSVFIVDDSYLEAHDITRDTYQDKIDLMEFLELSLRERDVMLLIAEGQSNKIIAEQLNIAENTVKNHLTSIFGKLHMHNRTQVAAYTWGRGMMQATHSGQ